MNVSLAVGKWSKHCEFYVEEDPSWTSLRSKEMLLRHDCLMQSEAILCSGTN